MSVNPALVKELDNALSKMRKNAHNINNLMTVVYGRIELLISFGDCDEKTKKELKIAWENSRKAMEMLKGISEEAVDLQQKIKEV